MFSTFQRCPTVLSKANLYTLQACKNHTKIAMVGGGCGGMSVVAHILRKGGIVNSPSDITVFDPSSIHYYQPSFTMVSGGVLGKNENIKETLIHRPLNSVFNSGVNIIRDKIGEYDPDNNTLYTGDKGEKYSYDYLIVSTGIETRYDLIEGALDALNDPSEPVGSMYRFDYAQKMNTLRNNMKEGKFVGTQPNMPIKCGGAPQKLVYLSDSDFRQRNVRNNIDMHFYTQLPVMFPVKKYGDALYELAKSKDINVHFSNNISKVDTTTKTVFFKDSENNEISTNYDLLHIVPPQKPNEITAKAKFSDANGFVDVNKYTMQSTKYSNIFSLGDCSNIPTSKTAAAALAQSSRLVHNLSLLINNKSLISSYDGYTSCPIFTGNKQLMLAEFVFNNVPNETFKADQKIPKQRYYYIKRHLFPFVYWNLVPKGQWFGRNHVKEPNYVNVSNEEE